MWAVSTQPTSPDSGLLLNSRYRVEHMIARGGMATVYKGFDERLERPVALKIMHPHLADNPEFVSRFAREARSAARLTHPHVVSVYDQGFDQGRTYLAMQLVEGETLRDELRREKSLTLKRSLRVGRDVLAALDAAHRSGIIHRDIKPENVLVDQNKDVLVADFGLARAVGASTSSSTGTLLGTVSYVSPEVITRGSADARSDLYSWGIMMYEMLTGQLPFQADSAVQIAFKHVHEDIPAPSSIAAGIPASINALITWASARQPSSRPARAHEILLALDEALTTLTPAELNYRLDTKASGSQVRQIDQLPTINFDSDTKSNGEIKDKSTAFGSLAPGEDEKISGEGAGNELASGEVRSKNSRLDALNLGSMAEEKIVASKDQHLGLTTAELNQTINISSLTASQSLGTDGAPKPAQAPKKIESQVAKKVWKSKAPAKKQFNYLEQDVDESIRELKVNPFKRKKGIHGDFKHRSQLLLRLSILLSLFAGAAIIWTGNTWYSEAGPGAIRQVPLVSGATLEDAENAFNAQQLLVNTSEAFSDEIPRGRIISTNPAAGTEIKKGEVVMLVVSLGEELFEVPALAGLSSEEALNQLKGLPFEVETVEEFSDDYPAGAVISLSDQGNSLPRDSKLTLTISKGQEPIKVPSLSGLSQESAQAALLGLNLNAAFTSAYHPSVPSGLVISQDVNPNAEVPPGTTISAVVSLGPEMLTVPEVFRLSEEEATNRLKEAGFEVSVVYERGVPIFGLVAQQSIKAGELAARNSVITITVY